MNTDLPRLIPAIVSYVTEHGGYVTKTKLLKLIYLFDVEYYRLHRETFSGFEWKFFHLGPWTREFDPLLDNLLGQEVILASAGSKPEYETKFFKTSEPFDFQGLFSNYKDESALKVVLDRWGESSTGEILDYVYFRTEPMECGVRYEPLDFSKIAEQPPQVYTRRASGKTKQELDSIRKKFHKDTAHRTVRNSEGFSYTPPNYDKEFLTALSKLNRLET